jgi:hypothetical protein
LSEPLDYNYGEYPSWRNGERGDVKIIAGDFFARDWEAACRIGDGAGFDLIYDYTVRGAHLFSVFPFCQALIVLP